LVLRENVKYGMISPARYLNTMEVLSMAKCEVCQKDTFFGRKISITRSQVSRRALTTQQPNVRNVKVVVDGTPKTMHVCTRCLRSGDVKRA
jgi:large subunit ribosomal protein L28